MEADEEVQEFYSLSREYLAAAEDNLLSGIIEPAMFNAIHALELALKSVLLKTTGENFKTHNIGGIFGKHFKGSLGKEKCKRVNKILMRYNLPRYPTQLFPSKIEVEDDIDFISKFIKNDIETILKE